MRTLALLPDTTLSHHERDREDPYFSDIREWLQEFRENLVDGRVLERRDSPASSSHGLSLEPTGTADLGKHSVYAHFPTDRNCEICQRTKITRGPCRRRIGRVVPRAENFGDLITADHKVLSESCEARNNHRLQSWCKTWPPNGSRRIRAKQKLLRKPKAACKSSWNPNRKSDVVHTDNSFEFGKVCEDLSRNHCASTPHRSETNGIAERAVRRVKEGTSAVLLHSGLDEKWWADSMECSTYLRNVQDLLSDGETPYERRFGKPFRGPIIPFGSLVSITLPLRKTSQESINLERKSYLDCPSDTLCTREELGRVTFWPQTLRS